MLAYDEFQTQYGAKHPKAVECVTKDEDVLCTFYEFPAEYRVHICTTNRIESTFATVRYRHRQTKGSGSRTAAFAMVFKLGLEAGKKWRKRAVARCLGENYTIA